MNELLHTQSLQEAKIPDQYLAGFGILSPTILGYVPKQATQCQLRFAHPMTHQLQLGSCWLYRQ
jgi:hypothetical protein